MGSTARAHLWRRGRARAADEAGFTLPELLVSMAILLIILTSLTSVLVTASRTEVDANKRFQAQGQARTGLEEFRHEVHCGSSVTQDDTSGTPLAAGTAYAAVTVTLGSICPGASPSTPTTYATWCTAASTVRTGDFALYRVTSTALPRPTCASTGKVKWMDYLQPSTLTPTPMSTPFCLPSTTVACNGVLKPATSLPLLHVTFPVNLNGPTSTIASYDLVDDIALRNGSRS